MLVVWRTKTIGYLLRTFSFRKIEKCEARELHLAFEMNFLCYSTRHKKNSVEKASQSRRSQAQYSEEGSC
jgi:lactate dehydrogenase-like 2-hydroxyacid dehydrogenase